MSEVEAQSPTKAEGDTEVQTNTTPSKTPSKRRSKIERDRAESEEIIKAMGGAVEEGGRRTRSSARVANAAITAAVTPPPSKRAKAASGGGSTPSRRGRPKKLDEVNHENDIKEADENDAIEEKSVEEEKEPVADGNAKKKVVNDKEKEPEKMEVDGSESNKDESGAKEKTVSAAEPAKDVASDVKNDTKEKDSLTPNSTAATGPTITVTEPSPAKVNRPIVESPTVPTVPASDKKDESTTKSISTDESKKVDSPVKRPNEDAAVPETAAKPVTGNSIVQNDKDAVAAPAKEDTKVSETKTEERKVDDAKCNEPSIKAAESTPPATEATAAL